MIKIDSLIGLSAVLCIFCFAWAILQMPRDFRHGILPRVEEINAQQTNRIDQLTSKLDNLQNSIMASCFIGGKSK